MFEFFDFIYQFLTSGIFTLIKDAFVWLISSVIIFYYEMKYSSLLFAWDVAESILDELNLSVLITQSFNALPETTKQTMAFFKIPEFLNLVISAFTTRLVMRFLPFI